MSIRSEYDRFESSRLQLATLIPLCAAGFIGFLNVFGLTPFFASVGRELDVSVTLVGYTATAGLLTTAFAGLIIAPLSERFGSRSLVLAGLVVVVASGLMTALATSYPLLLTSRLAAGAAGAITSGITLGIAADIHEGRARQQAMAIVSGAIAMAVVVGIVLMTGMATFGDWRTAYTGLAGIAAVTLIFSWIRIPETQQSSESGETAEAMFSTLRRVLKDRPTARLLLATALHSGALNGLTAFTGAFMETQREMSTNAIGFIFSMLGGGYVLGNVLAGRVPRERHRPAFVIGIVSMGLIWSVAFIVYTPTLVTVVLLGLATLGAGISWVTLLTMLSNAAPVKTSIAMVLSTSMLSFGSAAGTGIAATILGLAGYTGLAFGMAIMALGASVVGLIPHKSTKDQSNRG